MREIKIPGFVGEVISEIEKNNFEVFLVGGCVRDLLMGIEPKDWDLATNARPEQMLEIFENAKYENDFGTVILPIKNKKQETENVLEITTYRSESKYGDHRHPEEINFEEKIDKDLARRDFTVNALAMKPTDSPIKINSDLEKFIVKVENFLILDLFGGAKDVNKKIIRAVGEPSDRFREDALRMMRAVRFSAQLGFEIEPKTERAVKKLSGAIKFVANERIKDELVKILKSENAYFGIKKMHETGLLKYILPEVEDGVGVKQDRHHIYTVFKHSIYSLKHCPNKDWQVKFAALLHDIGKVKTRKIRDGVATFYNHEYVSAKLTDKIMKRLKFSNNDKERVVNLVRNHMFYYNVDEVTASSVRRLIRKTGEENLKDLIDLRIADRLGSGTPKAKPYKLRHLEYMMDKVRKDPISVKMLAINGDNLIKDFKMQPGPKIGAILDALLSEVIDDPELNNKEYLEERVRELDKKDLKNLRETAKEKIKQENKKQDRKIKNKHKVK